MTHWRGRVIEHLTQRLNEKAVVGVNQHEWLTHVLVRLNDESESTKEEIIEMLPYNYLNSSG